MVCVDLTMTEVIRSCYRFVDATEGILRSLRSVSTVVRRTAADEHFELRSPFCINCSRVGMEVKGVKSLHIIQKEQHCKGTAVVAQPSNNYCTPGVRLVHHLVGAEFSREVFVPKSSNPSPNLDPAPNEGIPRTLEQGDCEVFPKRSCRRPTLSEGATIPCCMRLSLSVAVLQLWASNRTMRQGSSRTFPPKPRVWCFSSRLIETTSSTQSTSRFEGNGMGHIKLCVTLCMACIRRLTCGQCRDEGVLFAVLREESISVSCRAL